MGIAGMASKGSTSIIETSDLCNKKARSIHCLLPQCQACQHMSMLHASFRAQPFSGVLRLLCCNENIQLPTGQSPGVLVQRCAAQKHPHSAGQQCMGP